MPLVLKLHAGTRRAPPVHVNDASARRIGDRTRLGIADAALVGMTLQEAILWQGVGQSGYTSGRREHDPALDSQMQTRNTLYPRGIDGEKLVEECGTDDRWTGRGGLVPPDEAGALPEVGKTTAEP